MVDFLNLASKEIPNLGGIKYSKQDLIQLAVCANFQNGKYEMLFGVDEVLLCGLMAGASGAVGSTYNYLAPLNHRMIDAFNNGHLGEAQESQYQVIQLVNTLSNYGFHAASKHVLKFMGIDLGPVRMPLQNLTAAQVQMLEKDLAALDILEVV